MKLMIPEEDGTITIKLSKDSGCPMIRSHKLELPLPLKMVSGMPLMAQLEHGPTTHLAMVDSGRKLMAPKEVAGNIHPPINSLENGGTNKTLTAESGTPMNTITTSESPPQMQRVEFGMLLMPLKEPGLTLKKKEADGPMKTKLRPVLGTLIKVQISLEFGKMIMANSKEPGNHMQAQKTSKLLQARPQVFGMLLMSPKDIGTQTPKALEDYGRKMMHLTLVPGNILDLTISLEGGQMMTELLKAVGNQMKPHHRLEWQQSLETLNLPMVKEACG